MHIPKLATLALLALLTQSCGSMDNNNNEDHSQYTDSAGVNPDQAGAPDGSTAPMRNVYDTDSATATSGPDNAAPMQSNTDSSAANRPPAAR